VLTEPGAEPAHFEFLATDDSDPRHDFITPLCAALGDNGSIIVYNQQFESQRLAELAAWLAIGLYAALCARSFVDAIQIAANTAATATARRLSPGSWGAQ
jgi:hypothetical protein